MHNAMYRRSLSRSSAHRQALLRNLVTSLIAHETISTTYAKAKEAQRVAEKLITLGKRNTTATQEKAKAMLFEPHLHLGKVFGELRERYAERPGGYTRLLLSEPLKDDQAKSAVLSLVDGPKDMRFAMTARAILRQQTEDLPMNDITATNIRKVTRFRKDGVEELADAVRKLEIRNERVAKREQEEFEQKGTRFQWTTELKRSDPRWREKRGPGRLVKRRIQAEEDEDLLPYQGPS